MVLLDTSIWIDHLRVREEAVSRLLADRKVLVHPFVTGEIALGTLRNRKDVLQMLGELPQAALATPDEVLRLTEEQKLFGIGIGYVDVHLLASLRLTPNSGLWTRDKRLDAAARQIGVALAKSIH